MDTAFDYLKGTGLCSESDYPYTAKDSESCKLSSCEQIVKISNYYDVAVNDVDALMEAVAQ